MLGSEREAGAWGRDEIRNITGNIRSYRALGSTASAGCFSSQTYRTTTDGGGATGTVGYDTFDPSRVVPTGPQNVPQHIWQPVILYLGRPK